MTSTSDLSSSQCQVALEDDATPPGDDSRLCVRIGLFFDEPTRTCSARTLEGTALTARGETYRKAAGQLRRLLSAHHARPVAIQCDIIMPDKLAKRVCAFRETRAQWKATGEVVRAEATALVAELTARNLNAVAVSTLMQLTTAQVTALQRSVSKPTRAKRRGRPRAIARAAASTTSRLGHRRERS